MKTKYFLVFLVLLLSQVMNNNAYAQKCVSFKYDGDGNRIKRYVQNNCIEIKGDMEVEENDDVPDIAVYPNPTSGNIKIIMPNNAGDEQSFCRVYDVNGVLIFEKYLANETDVDIGDMPSGIYLLQIISGVEKHSKIIVKH